MKQKFKQGATSIYVVVISTLLFSVITVSFIRIIISETNRTTSDELAQSAYDSALAGVEDTKTALKSYYECLAAETDENGCDVIKHYIQEGFRTTDLEPNDPDYGYCDAISQALGRIGESENKEVIIQEKDSSQNEDDIIQAYTCVTIDDTLADYRATLSSGNSLRVIPLKTPNPENVTGIQISWYTEDDGVAFSGLNYANQNSFNKLSEGTPIPPTITAEIIQTGPTYNIDQFNNTENGETNRGTVVLVPARQGTAGAKTHITKDVLLDSNDHSYDRSTTNVPQKISCEEEEFACTASFALPNPIGGGDRNPDTFFLVISLPYGQPTTTFSVQLCQDHDAIPGDCEGDNAIAEFKGAQIAVDSTGRANDMYSRVEARVEFNDIFFPFPEFAVQATSPGDDAIKKNFYVTSNCFKTNADGSISPCSTDPDENDTGEN